LNRRLLTIVLAALLAVIGTVAVLEYVHKANVRAIAGLQSETVLAAKTMIPAHTSLGEAQSEGWLTTEQLPVKSVPAGALTSIKGSAGLVFNATVQPSQIVLRPMLVAKTADINSGSALNIKTGYQAVSIQFCIPEEVAGYLTVGSEVDVYETFPTSSAVNLQRTCSPEHQALWPPETKTELLLQNVEVLSVTPAPAGTQSASSGSSSVLSDPASSASSSGVAYVTFDVTESQATQLIKDSQVELPYLGLLPPPNS
jgi:pilus assembly protein CpaB